MSKPKRFDRKKGVTFQLVHRSQQDPLVADEKAPQRVLLPIANKDSKNSRDERLEEQHKYGIFYDDDFNYLQHIKETKDNRMEWPDNVDEELAKRQEEAKLKLPSSVFASEVEEEVGMLNKAAPVSGPQLHLDPDVVAAMDDDFDYSDPENELEDNFIELANGIASDQEVGTDEEIDMDADFDGETDSFPGSQNSFDKEETKSRFTNYSVTSSVIRRNDQLRLLDARFEKMLENYEKSDSEEDVDGCVPSNSDYMRQLAEKFEKSQKRQHLDKHDVAEKIREYMVAHYGKKEEFKTVRIPEKPKYDCQSIISMYSNTQHLPKLLDDIYMPKEGKIAVDKKTGIPKNVLDSNKLTIKALNNLNEDKCRTGPASIGKESMTSRVTTLSIRDKNETLAEKKERKHELKEYRRERRKEKKANKEAFKEETKRQVKVTINNRNNVQGNKML